MKVLDVQLPKAYQRHSGADYPVVGVDTESLITGYAFLVADSSGKHVWIKSFDDVVKFFDYEDYEHCLLVAFNLDFDASVMLKWLGEALCEELVRTNYVSTNNCAIHYVPGKFLQLRYGNRFVRIFDIAQYFRGSLNWNAQQYLHAAKTDIGSKEFTEKDYGRQDVLTYCSHDAVLTQGLGAYVTEAFDKIGVRVSSLASSASIVESYVLDQLELRSPVREDSQGMLEFSMQAFDGAWFENFKAGYFPTTYRYDLVSAYPAVIRNLLDLSLGYFVRSIKRPKNAEYGRAYATVTVPGGYISPVIFRNALGQDMRPHGTWTRHFPVQILDWAREHGAKVTIHDAWWFIPDERVYKFRSVVDKFFGVKKSHTADSMEHWSSKIALTGIYGKFLQHRNNMGGRLYNPLYASEITANVQLMIADACMLDPSKVIAVMSDCVSCVGRLPLRTGRDIGDWALKGVHASLWIGPAQYESEGREDRFRKIPWKDLLEKEPDKFEYTVSRNSPLSLLQGIAQNRFEDIGVFMSQSIKFDIRKLNWRRFWPSRPKCGGDLLNNQYDSRQLHVSSRLKEEDMKLWEL